ncbi:hypothetical protein [Spirulina subsalsa]|uniref:hypothetical protein n=1 Tax=Spirulina subsalsa TaxID=54311 RepID=UPI0013E0A533|nr:hypothetical protein [Spirulina subsalsa]
MMTQSDLLVNRAKEGNIEAIATLIAHQLAPKQIKTQVNQKSGVLNILFESEKTPSQAQLVPWITKALNNLQPKGIKQVRLYGRIQGQSEIVWKHQIELNSLDQNLSIKKPAIKTHSSKAINNASSHQSKSKAQSTVSRKSSSKHQPKNSKNYTPIVQSLHNQKLAIITTAIAGCFSTFLPWTYVPILGTLSGAAGDGWITLVLFIPAIVVALKGDRLTPLVENPRWIAVIPAGLAGFIGLSKIFVIGEFLSIGIGLYLLIFSSGLLCISAWFLENRKIDKTQISIEFATKTLGSFHKQRLTIIGSGFAGCVATFLPWLYAPIVGSVSGTQGDGWITLCLFLPAIVLGFRGKQSTPLVQGNRLLAIIPAGIAGLIGIAKVVEINKLKSGLSHNAFAQALSASVDIGFGLYLLIAASIAICVTAWLLEKKH